MSYISFSRHPPIYSVCLSWYMSICFVCLYTYMSGFLPVHRLISYLCVYVSLLLVCVYYLCQLSVSPYVCSAVCLFASPSIHLYAYMFVYRSSIMSANMNVFFAACVYMYVYLCVYVCLSDSLCITLF